MRITQLSLQRLDNILLLISPLENIRSPFTRQISEGLSQPRKLWDIVPVISHGPKKFPQLPLRSGTVHLIHSLGSLRISLRAPLSHNVTHEFHLRLTKVALLQVQSDTSISDHLQILFNMTHMLWPLTRPHRLHRHRASTYV